MSDFAESSSELEEEAQVGQRAGHLPSQHQPTAPPRRDGRWLSRLAGNQHVQRLLSRVRGGGKPLDTATRQALEPIFRHDLSQVRVHSDPEAQNAALEAGAAAVTRGHDIYLGPGRNDQASSTGRQLVAHEVAHVIQQTVGGNQAASPVAAEGEAQRAADSAAAGQPVDVSLSTADPVPAFAPGNWGDDVRAAQALAGSAQATTMLALVKRALTGAGITVVLAGNASPSKVDPADYTAAPTLNFDPNLNSKQSWPTLSGGPTKSLSINYGYFFGQGATPYAIIGPKALNADSEIFTQMYANHELYHASHHMATKKTTGGAVTGSDDELETWTHDFLGYFHQLHTFGPQWAPLISYYETASATAQTTACTALAGYYKAPPVPASDVPKIQKAFERWLRRRLADQGSMKLVKDLPAALGITATPSTP